MEKISPRTLSGFVELLPREQQLFERFTDTLRECYSLYGFTPLDTPVIESASVLLAKGGGETEKQVYRFTRGDSDLALRFDLTVPLAKYVAQNYASLSFPFRRYQIGKVYRGERAQRGRFREFYQADIDIIGDGTLDIMSEAEIPSVIYRTFTRLGLTRFKIRVNNRKLLNGFYESLGLAGSAAEIMRAVDKLDKIGPEKLRGLLTGDELALTDAQADAILSFITLSGENSEAILKKLEAFSGRSALFDEGLGELGTVVRCLGGFGVPEDNFAIDLTIARGLDYYTGTVYETSLTDYPDIGSVCSGGRYDDLAGFYTDKKLPGVGIAIGLTRLFYVLSEQGLLRGDLPTAPADALVLPMDDDLGWAIRACTALRDRGVRVSLYTERKKFKAKMSYCDKNGFPFAVIIGEDERAQGVVSLKDMRSGEQLALTPEQAAERILSALEKYKNAPVIREKGI